MNLSKRWPFFVVALLSTHVGLMSWAVVKCVRDPNSAIIPNYYEKAVRYDEFKAARAREAAAAATQGQRP
jgi:hypothetical protein